MASLYKNGTELVRVSKVKTVTGSFEPFLVKTTYAFMSNGRILKKNDFNPGTSDAHSSGFKRAGTFAAADLEKKVAQLEALGFAKSK